MCPMAASASIEVLQEGEYSLNFLPSIDAIGCRLWQPWSLELYRWWYMERSLDFLKSFSLHSDVSGFRVSLGGIIFSAMRGWRLVWNQENDVWGYGLRPRGPPNLPRLQGTRSYRRSWRYLGKTSTLLGLSTLNGTALQCQYGVPYAVLQPSSSLYPCIAVLSLLANSLLHLDIQQPHI